MLTAGDYSSTQIQSMGLNPNETSSAQKGPDGQWYKLDNNGRGGRILKPVSIIGTGEGPGGFVEPGHEAEYFMNELKKTLTEQMDTFNKRYSEFTANNPFTFDEAQARASAEERYSPYYDAQLNDMIKGIDRQRQSTQGEKDLLVELNRISVGADKRALDEAIRSSEEGYAGVGLFDTGARRREGALTGIQGAEQAQQKEKQFTYGQQELGRNLEGINQQEATGKRELGAAKTTDVESETARLKAEEAARYAQERAQYIGYPYISKVQGGLNELLGYTFQP